MFKIINDAELPKAFIKIGSKCLENAILTVVDKIRTGNDYNITKTNERNTK